MVNYCVSIRQPEEVLERADEIFCEYKDIQGLYNFDDKPKIFDKTFILQIPYDPKVEVDWKEIAAIGKTLHLVLALEDLHRDAASAASTGCPYYWIYPISTYEEANDVIDLGVSELKLDAPLYFSIPTVALLGKRMRLTANLCTDRAYSTHANIQGCYIRPEDVKYYADFPVTLEFVTENHHQEEGLFNIYSRDQKWPGNLNLLLTNLNFHCDNRAFPEEFGATRLKCGHRCFIPGQNCHYCASVFYFVKALNDNRHMSPDEWNTGAIAEYTP